MNNQAETLKDQSIGLLVDNQRGKRCPLPEILDSHEMSEIFGISRLTLARWRERGLPYIRIGIKCYFIESSILEWLKTLEVRETGR